jgi:hypothetical protein
MRDHVGTDAGVHRCGADRRRIAGMHRASYCCEHCKRGDRDRDHVPSARRLRRIPGCERRALRGRRCLQVSPQDDNAGRAAMNDRTDFDDLTAPARDPLYQAHTARRGSARVTLRLPVQIGLAGGRVVIARLYKLSADGIQIRCSRPTATGILPDSYRLAAGNGPQLLVVMRLTAGRDTRSHVIRCRVSYALPESTDEVIMGLAFLELLPEQRAAIDAMLGASLEARG